MEAPEVQRSSVDPEEHRPRTPHTYYEQFLALCRFGSLARWIFRSDHNQDDYPFLFQAYLVSFRTEDPLMLPEYRQRTEYHTPEAILESDFSFSQSLVLVCKLVFFCLP